ncbi:hypothetical protein CY35_15G049700 [Sphagnum magellanicum]|nr:hypothetical protein CY35_15G049700 [Sphagnum magellanicum]
MPSIIPFCPTSLSLSLSLSLSVRFSSFFLPMACFPYALTSSSSSYKRNHHKNPVSRCRGYVFCSGCMCAFDVVVVVLLLLAAALDGFHVVRFTCRFFFFLICGRSFFNLL